MKFVTVLVAISALTCIYVWQASTISDINKTTAAIKAEAVELERTNVGLAIDVARWNAPGYIEGEARRQGMTPDQQPLSVVVPELTAGGPAVSSADDLSVQLWQRLTGWLPPQATVAFAMR